MHELGAARAVAVHEPGTAEGKERAIGLVNRHVRDYPDELRVEPVPEHAGDPCIAKRACRGTGEAGEEQLCGGVQGPEAGQARLGLERASDLVNKKRITGTGMPDLCREGRLWWTSGEIPEQLLASMLAERLQSLEGGLAGGDELAHDLVSCRWPAPQRTHDHDGEAANSPAYERQELERVHIGPVQVVKEDEGRPAERLKGA